MKTMFILAIAVFALQGCASTSKALKDNPATKITFTVDQSYQQTYKNLNTQMRDCLGEGHVGGGRRMFHRSEIYPALKMAEISRGLSDVAGSAYGIHIEITETTQHSSQVTFYGITSIGSARLSSKIQRWANNPDAGC